MWLCKRKQEGECLWLRAGAPVDAEFAETPHGQVRVQEHLDTRPKNSALLFESSNRRALEFAEAAAQGQKVTASPSLRLKFAPPSAGSRYQSWKYQVEPAVIAPSWKLAGAELKSTSREYVPSGSIS